MPFQLRPAINEIFTPRGASINSKIYVERTELERELVRALKGSLHVIVFGDSGNGKSWLYKKVLGDLGWRSIIANCANASRTGSLTQEIYNTVMAGSPTLESYTEAKGANVLGAKLEHTNQYDVPGAEPLFAAFQKMRANSDGGRTVLVLDNLEQIFSSKKLMEELGNIITLLDDERYAQSNVKLLIVGVPSGVTEYFAKTPNLHTVANRVQEISEVASLSQAQVNLLIKKGLIDQLGIKIDPFDFENWQDHIYSVTLGIAQRVHEYCEQLAYVAEEAGWVGRLEQIDRADHAWLKLGLKESYHVVQSLMNERETKAGRRNQVLYALGRINSRTFNPARVEEVLRNHFVQSTENVALAIGQILADLSERQTSIVKRTPKGDEFEFTDPRYAMSIRAMLKLGEDEKVKKVELK
ncbi:MAG: nSTAND1 domain-containing NTPase [Burkholderiales bacterium]